MGFFDRGSAPSKTATSRTPAPSGGGKSGRIDYRDPALNGPFYPGTTRQEFRDDPNWRYQHTPGSDRGAHTGFKAPKPAVGGPTSTPEQEAAYQEMRARTEKEAFAKRGMPFSTMQEWKDSDPEYVKLRDAFKNATDPRAKAQALKAANAYDTKRQMAFKNKNARDAFIAQGGQGSTWDHRFDEGNDWPKPRSPLGAYSHGPGSADWDTRFTNPVPPNTIGGGRGGGGNDAANTPSSGRELNEWLRDHPETQGGGGAGGIQGYLGDGAATPRQGLPEWAQAAGGATTGQSDVLAALSRLQGLPIGAPTAATNAPGGFARAASPIPPAVAMAGAGAPKKPTIVRRGGGVVSRA